MKYSYDEAGRLTEVKRGSEVVVLHYDEADRLTGTTLPPRPCEQCVGLRRAASGPANILTFTLGGLCPKDLRAGPR